VDGADRLKFIAFSQQELSDSINYFRNPFSINGRYVMPFNQFRAMKTDVRGDFIIPFIVGTEACGHIISCFFLNYLVTGVDHATY
jgi:hypothetical protein